MSFAKIAETRAVKKIVAYIREQIPEYPDGQASRMGLEILAAQIEEGAWKKMGLPKRKR